MGVYIRGHWSDRTLPARVCVSVCVCLPVAFTYDT